MPHRAAGDKEIVSAGVPHAITVGASPFTYTNAGVNTELVYVTIPASVTATIAKGGFTVASLTTPAATVMTIPMFIQPGGSIVLTYNAGAPTMARDSTI